MRTDEVGLSRILADLLDPSAAHGQGTVFLLSLLNRVRHKLPGERVPTLQPGLVDTLCERTIDDGGRLDISIEIRGGTSGPLCIVIENKPYSADGKNQVDAYLRFLRSRYPGRHLLIYLSPHGGLPAPESLPPDARRDGLTT